MQAPDQLALKRQIENHRKRGTFLCWVGLTLASGLALMALTWGAVVLLDIARPNSDARVTVIAALLGFVSNIPFIGDATVNLLAEVGLSQENVENLYNFAFLAGVTVAIPSVITLAGRMYFYWFSPFDSASLAPILMPHAFDPLRHMIGADPDDMVLPWHDPEAGPRFEAHSALCDLCFGEGDKLEYQLLLGGPGAGKSRLAVEFARRSLAKLSADSEGESVIHGPNNTDRLMTWRDYLTSWWRVRVLKKAPTQNDPWDIGWIKPEMFVKGAAKTKKDIRVAMSQLQMWRPRRPTFLLLDDPLPGNAIMAVDMLQEASQHYRHRVRLLIVNQSIPSDLQITHKQHKGDWDFRGYQTYSDPILLPSIDQFDDGELRRLVYTIPSNLAQPIVGDAGIAKFRKITRANPLLIELALSWLRRVKSFADMSEDSLLEERAERIFEAIKTAGMESDVADLLAMATIASGCATNFETNDGTNITNVWEAFNLRRIDQTTLARLYPTQTERRGEELPPIQPKMIGLAFVRRVLSELHQADQDRIIKCAWQANPRGTLRTLLGIDADYAVRHGHDPLRDAFERSPIQHAGLSDLEVFRVLSRTSCLAHVTDWNEGRPLIGAGLLAAAERAAQLLDVEALEQALEETVAWSRKGMDGFYVREAAASRMVGFLMRELQGRGALFSNRSLAAFEDWMRHCQSGKCALSTWRETKQHRKLVAPKDYDTERMQSLAYASLSREVRLFGLIVWAEMQEDSDESVRVETARSRIKAEDAIRASDKSAWKVVAKQVDRILAGDGLNSVVHLRALLSAISVCAFAGEQLMLKYIEELDRIAAPFPESEAIQQERAAAWRVVAYASTDDCAACQRHAERVDRIAAPFPESEAIQKQRAEAWRFVAYASNDDRAACQRHAETVDRIAAPFPESEAIQKQRAEAWCLVAYTSNDDRASCQRHAETVGRIAAPFPESEAIQTERAMAWRFVAYASTDDRAACQRHAERVDRIAAPFPESEAIQTERAMAWRFVADASTDDRAACQRHAETVGRIAGPFPESEAIQQERATAWRFVAYASTDDRAACQRHAETVDRIAGPFPESEAIQQERATAWRFVAYASTDDRAACQRHAETVDRIAAPVPENEAIQRERAEAWRFVAYASTDDRAACQRHAETVDRIAGPFPESEAIHQERATAWRHVAYAFWDDPKACQQFVETVGRIAALFPKSAAIQQELATARRNLDLSKSDC
ncbi:hypothetical protein JQV15_15165 [Sulfitobacter mediterraneus]|uniref:hypothetical protein n=2 Tax=Sulfitobacter mediterraneus TaxID=83219 RepID=UPI0019397C65|nr:hypothetical protein [Sulfitobacter mediterraneus]MBM1599970.1 hypothetical protein [Sulfitobacter mediterraneus]